jgi:hypothetical protein
VAPIITAIDKNEVIIRVWTAESHEINKLASRY